MDEGSSNSNRGYNSFNQDPQTSNCFFDETTKQKVHTNQKHSASKSVASESVKIRSYSFHCVFQQLTIF